MESLKKEHCWCVRDEGKIPYAAVNMKGKVDDRSTWLSYTEAKTLWETNPDIFTGIGFYFSERENDENMVLCGIDIDAIGHNTDHPTHNPLEEELLTLFQGTYAEKTPSGTGFHIVCNIDKNLFPFSKDYYPFQKKNMERNLEVYVTGTTKRYFTYTGKRLESHNDIITDQTENVISILLKYMSNIKKPKQITRHITPADTAAPTVPEPDIDIEKRLNLIRNSPKRDLFEKLYEKGDTTKYKSDSEADFALLGLLVPWLEGNVSAIDKAFRGSALYRNGREDKWDSRRGNTTYGEISIKCAVALSLDPYYSEDPEYATGDSIKPEDIVQMINEVQNDTENKDKVSVLPYACGLGKSSAISYKIAEVLQSESTDGLIIVTDSKDRMKQYPAPTNERMASLKEYIEAHSEEISIMESGNFKTERERQRSCKILIMTTQRYFQYSSREQIISYTTWDKGRRPLVIIDEKPGVLDSGSFNISQLNKIEDIIQSMKYNNRYFIEMTKTISGRRIIPMTDEVYESLQNIVKNRPKLKTEQIIDGYTGFILIDKNGKPKVAQHIENECRWAMYKYRKLHPDKPLPNITPHVYRHTFCTKMAQRGMDLKALQYLMGHADAGITMNVYSHTDYDYAAAQMKLLMKKNVV